MNGPDADKLLHAAGDLDDLAEELDRVGAAFPRRINADPEHVERGLAQLVLTLVELLRQLMERQALRRMEQGTLTDEQVERLGETFMKLEQRMEELKREFEPGGSRPQSQSRPARRPALSFSDCAVGVPDSYPTAIATMRRKRWLHCKMLSS